MGNWIVQQWLFQYLVKSFMKVHGHPCEQYIFCLYISSTFKAIKTCYILMKIHWHASAKKTTDCLYCSAGIWRTAVIRCSGVHQLGRCSQRSVSSLVSAKIWIIQSGILQIQYYVYIFFFFFPSFFLSKHLNIGTSGNELEVLHNGNCIVLLSASEQKHCTPVIIMRLNEWLKVYTAHLEYPPECCLVIVCLMPYEAVAVLVHILCTHTTKHQFTESLSLKPHT